MAEIENRMVVDEYWVDIEKEPKAPEGYFDQFNNFVHKDCLLEVALEEVQTCNLTKDRFLELICDYIESNSEAKEKFLKWYYPDYKEE
jgi:hypothetical protein